MSIADSSALRALSNDLAAAVERAQGSVVYVDANRRRDASGIVWTADTVVTTDHTIDREEDIELLAAGGKTQARVIGRDPSTDIALLRSDAPLAPAARGDLEALRVGHIVLAVARDEDGSAAASLGVVSALDGPWRTWRGGDVERFVRPDLNVYPGFSGGPLVNVAGEVLGMNTWALSRRTALTLPLGTLERVVAQLAAGGRIKRGYLGVAMQAVRLPQALRAQAELAQETGLIVVDVAPGGPAERAGLMIGDVIVALAGRAVEDADDLQRALGSDTIGKALALRLVRAGKLSDIAVTVAERPNAGDDSDEDE